MDELINMSNNYKGLMAEFETLSTFAQVRDWGRRAEKEIQKISGIVRSLDMEISRQAFEIEKTRQEQGKKPLLGRLFGSGNNEEKDLTQHLERTRQSRVEMASAMEKLQEAIDFTPKSLDEQKALLFELRWHKKELLEKRREITAVIRGPRTKSQMPEEQAQVFDDATIARRKARYAKEAELLPQEKTRESIDRQTTHLDRDILWVEKFKE